MIEPTKFREICEERTIYLANDRLKAGWILIYCSSYVVTKEENTCDATGTYHNRPYSENETRYILGRPWQEADTTDLVSQKTAEIEKMTETIGHLNHTVIEARKKSTDLEFQLGVKTREIATLSEQILIAEAALREIRNERFHLQTRLGDVERGALDALIRLPHALETMVPLSEGGEASIQQLINSGRVLEFLRGCVKQP